MSQPSQPTADLSSNEKRALLAQLLRKKASGSETYCPLSHNQQGIWFLCQFAPEISIYNVSFAARISSDLDIPAMRRAFQSLVDRHPSLRTTFAVHSGKPVQQIHEHLEVYFEETDASTWREDELTTRLVEDVQRPFDLERGPLLRVSLFTRSAQEHILLLVVHHIVIDFWSLAVILNEIGVLYPAEKAGVHAALPPLDLQYTDYVRWQTEMLASPEGERLWDYWKKQLAGQLPVLNLPTDRPRPPIQTFRGAHHEFTVNDELARRLKALAKAEGATLYMVLLAAFDVMLYYHTGQEDILVASPMVGRSRAEFEGIVGFFANPVVLRANLAGNPTFRAFLGRVRQTVLAALEHQDYPTLRLVQRLRPTRDLSRAPLCQVMFVLDKPHRLAEQAVSTFVLGETGLRMNPGGLVLESFPLESGSATLDLAVLIMETPASLSVSIRYNTDLFDPATVARMAEHFETVLSHFVTFPNAKLSALKVNLAQADECQATILSDAERRQLLVEWNDTKNDYPRDLCIHQLFEAQVERTPEAVAVVFEGQQLTYRGLNARANQLARHLRKHGVGPDVLVGICMERSLETVVGLLGILKAGGAYMPLDPGYPKDRLAFMIEDSQAPALLTQERLLEAFPEHRARVICLDTDLAAIAQESEKNPSTRPTAENLAYVIYTSGSTGQPKGVQIEHRSVVNCLLSIGKQIDLSQRDVWLAITTISFDIAGLELYLPLITGSKIILANQDEIVDAGRLSARLKVSRATVMQATPSMWKLLVDTGWERRDEFRILCGGEALSRQLADRLLNGGTSVWNLYGPTESTIWSTLTKVAADEKSVSIGRPIANTQTYILDGQFQPAPIGVAGELFIAGDGLARSYLNRPELTAEKFVPNPFSDNRNSRLYRTGDRVKYRSDGNIEFLGRVDHQVKIRGFRIELGEIEAALDQHPAIRDAVVLAPEDAPGERRLVAYVVADGEPLPTTTELRSFLKEKLPEHMVPMVFVQLDGLPLMANGKLDRRALPAPDRTRPELEKAFVAPRTPTQELLSEIWAQVLDIKRVGIHDNFFDLGGHSLLATQVVSRIREAFQVELPLRRLFEVPTVAGLAESIEVAQSSGQNLLAPAILPVPREGNLPLSFAQQRLWFIDQLEPGNSAYNIPAAIRLRGPLNLAALEQSLNEILQRHESLRTSFAMVDGRPTQVIAPALTIKLPVVDLRKLPETERENEVRRLVNEAAQKPFDLAQGPLWRVALLRVAEEEHVGLLTLHHIVSDGWSTGILIGEMASLYVTFCSGGPSPLPELPIQYADFAVWQREWLQGKVLEGQLGYWRQQLADISVLQLPTDRPRPAVQTSRGKRQSVTLTALLSAALKALSRREGATLFMTLLAAFKILLHRYTGQDDLVVGTPIANRNRLETEGLVGCFVNALVLRTDLSGNPGFRDLLRRVREVCLGAYAHQDLPFEKLVEELYLERDLSRNPLFQVMFVLENISLQEAGLPGMTLSPVEADSETAHFDLTLVVVDAEQGLTASFVYNTDLFDAATITRMLGHFQILLQAMVADAERRLSDLPLLTAAERQQLLVQWNDTKTDYPRDILIHQLLETQAQRTPDAIAVVFEHAQLSYDELNRRANQLAHHLRALRVGPEVPVAVCLERSLDLVIGLLGILKAGGAYLPLDPACPKERLSLMLEDAQVPVLLTQTRLLAGLPESAAKVICLDSAWKTIASENAENPVNATTPENLAYVIYTSGSTAQPKGVLLSHRSLTDHCRSAQRHYELTAGDGVLQFASSSFDVSLEEILPTLIVGAKLVVMGTAMWPPAEFHRKISQYGLTVINLPSAYWQELARQWADVAELVPQIQPRLFIVGGETMLPEGLNLWQRTPVNSVRLVNAYGPTETTITATACEVNPRLCENRTFHRIPIGRPLANREVYILDKYGQPVPIGVPGELHIGGVSLARGYLNRPELTAEKFVPNPFSEEPGARLYRTGDLGRYLADGNIEFLGRVDHQVKIRGFRIELGEIEAALDQHPSIREAIVLAPEETPGDPSASLRTGKRLVAYVVAEGEPRPTTTELRSFLKEKLPEPMVPALFVLLDGLPLLANGKVDRGALPAPDRTRPDLEKAFVAPRDELELQLAQIWEDVLGVRPVGVRDNFFELGGHSLLAVRLFAVIDQRLGRKLPLTTVFQGATVEHLASVIRQQAQPGAHSSLVPIKPDGSKRPLFLVHPAGGHVFPYLYLAQYLDAERPCYGLQARGLEEGQEPHARIEDMAAYYIEALQTVQPTGPYLLGGWSMGGVVAFEMAQQLHAQGQRVALLALLDGRIPTVDETFPEENDEALSLVERYFGISFGPMESLAQLPKDEQLAFMLEQTKSAGLVPAELDVAEARRFIKILKSDFQASRNYELHLYPGRVTLFKASEELGAASPDPTLGWSEWAVAGVEVHLVPGNHANLVYEPHVKVLAEKLSASISQALAAEECLTQSQSTDPTMNQAP